MNKEILDQKLGIIEKILKDKLPVGVTFQKTISDAMEYSLMAGGKRIRPMLMMESFYFFGGKDIDELGYLMAALEMIHTYSLVHDDLPAMDDDEYRRGRKTTHVVYGEDMGILAGDALLNYAYEVMLKGATLSDYPKRYIKSMKIIAEKAGIFGMVGGQVLDVELTGKPIEKDQLDFIFRLKTAALIEAALMTGACMAGADEDKISIMEQVGQKTGVAFQIQDDILDVTGNEEELGKPVLSDEKNEKTTYVTLYGLEKAKSDVKKYSEEAVSLLKSQNGDNAFLEEIILSLIGRKK